MQPLHQGWPRGKSSGSWISTNRETSRTEFRNTVWDSVYETEQARPPQSRPNNVSQVPTDLLVPSAALNRASLPGGRPITKPDGGLPAQPCPHRASRESWDEELPGEGWTYKARGRRDVVEMQPTLFRIFHLSVLLGPCLRLRTRHLCLPQE